MYGVGNGYILIFFALSTIHCQRKPHYYSGGGICHRIDERTTYVSSEVVTAKRGSTAFLHCCVINAAFLGWSFNGDSLSSGAKYLSEYDSALKAQKLSVYNVQEGDAGAYFCGVSEANTNHVKKFPAMLNIRAELGNINNEYYLEISKTQMISLNVIGLPFPHIQLFKAGVNPPLVENFDTQEPRQYGRYEIDARGNIIIHNVEPNDTGKYIVRLSQGENQPSNDYTIDIYAGARPFVSFIPSPFYNFTLGQNEIIPARFSGAKLNIYWMFTSNFTSQPKRISDDTDSHYSIGVDGALSVINVISTDVGSYIGICSNPWGEVQVYTSVVQIIDSAKILVLNNVVASIGDNATFVVETSGNPPPSITWWRKGVQIPSQRINARVSVVPIYNVLRNHAGEYVCIADNGATSNGVRVYAVKKVTLYVQSIPIMNVAASSTAITVTENRRLVPLICVVTGYPPSEIRFLKDNNIIVPDQLSLTGKDNEVVATYYLSFTNDSQIGVYTCSATNSIGTQTLNMAVQFVGNPPKPTSIHIIDIQPYSVTIGWDFVSNLINNDVTSYLTHLWNKKYVVSVSQCVSAPRVTFDGLIPGTLYYFNAKAYNQAGWSWPSNTIEFVTPLVGRPSPPQILNREVFLPGIEFRLYWSSPLDSGGDAITTTYTVKRCLWDTLRIKINSNCEAYTNIHSNEIYFTGLISFQLYEFYVFADNSNQRSDPAIFQVFTGPNPIIGSPGYVSPPGIAAIIIAVTIISVLLLDLILCCCMKVGIMYWFLCFCCAKGIMGGSDDAVSLQREQSFIANRSSSLGRGGGDKKPRQYAPISEEEYIKRSKETYMRIEDHMYQNITEEDSTLATREEEEGEEEKQQRLGGGLIQQNMSLRPSPIATTFETNLVTSPPGIRQNGFTEARPVQAVTESASYSNVNDTFDRDKPRTPATATPAVSVYPSTVQKKRSRKISQGDANQILQAINESTKLVGNTGSLRTEISSSSQDKAKSQLSSRRTAGGGKASGGSRSNQSFQSVRPYVNSDSYTITPNVDSGVAVKNFKQVQPEPTNIKVTYSPSTDNRAPLQNSAQNEEFEAMLEGGDLIV